jgi:hypothetical protein
MSTLKKIVIVLLVCCSGFLHAAENNIMFENANELYHNKNYDSAAQLYQQMIDDGYCHPDLYYNAGNAYYRANKTGMAVWCFKKALQIEDKRYYRENLLLAQKKIKLNIQAADDIFFVSWWKTIYNLLSVNQWAIFTLLLFLLTMLLLFARNVLQRKVLSAAMGRWMTVVTVCSLCLMAAKYYQDSRHYHGIIIEDQTAFTAASKSMSATLSAGIEVEFVARSKNGMLVKLPDGRSGEISERAFKRL